MSEVSAFDAASRLTDAKMLHRDGRLDDAERLCRDVLSQAPGNAEALATLKTKLARNRNTAPLFDTPRYARNLERAYRYMWTRVQRGLPPQSLAVEGEP
jgi:GrpB-like predicted nucleotidyltransferase (UPF0157 family)